MKIITLEEHYSCDYLRKVSSKYGPSSKLKDLPDEYKQKLNSMRFIGNSLDDIDNERFKFMEEQKVDVQVLSYTSPISDSVPVEEAVKIAKEANNILADIVKRYPDKFLAFATLPMGDPIAAAEELERCVKELHFVGVLITGPWNGRFYDDPFFFPIFEKAAELDVPVYWHPEFPNGKIQSYYYLSKSYPDIVGMEFATAGFGWHLDVGLQMTRLILSGIFDKLPNLKFISGHWGEGIPSMIDRMDQIMKPQITGLKKKISEYFHDNVYYTPSGIMSKDQFDYMVKVFGADHILWALDYPYIPFDFCTTDFLLNSYLSDEEKELIAHKNAEKLFHLE